MKKANGLLDALTHRVTNVSHALTGKGKGVSTVQDPGQAHMPTQAE